MKPSFEDGHWMSACWNEIWWVLGCPFAWKRQALARRLWTAKMLYKYDIAPLEFCLFTTVFIQTESKDLWDNGYSLWTVNHSARGSMKSAAKRVNYCELQDILSSKVLNANSGFGYSWSHVRLRVDMCRYDITCCLFLGGKCLGMLCCKAASNLYCHWLVSQCIMWHLVELFDYLNFKLRPQLSETARWI